VPDKTTETKTTQFTRHRIRAVSYSAIHLTPQPVYNVLFLALVILVALMADIHPVRANDDTQQLRPGYRRPPNIPHTPSVIRFTRKHNDASTESTANTDDGEADTSDDLSVAPWAESTDFNPETGETEGQTLSNLEYDKILKDSPIDRGFGTAKVADIWERVRNGFGLSGYEHSRVDQALSWYVRNKKYLDRVTERAKPFFYYILQEIEKRHMPTEIALLPIVESAFQPFAYSPGRAAGLWQFIPETAKHYGLKLSWWYDGRRDVYLSTQAALDYLVHLQEHYEGKWLLALAAYNSGQGTVDRAIRKNLKQGKRTDFWSLHLPRETRGYVPKLLAVSALIGDPAAYHLTMNPIPNRPYFERINIGGQIDLALAAEMAGMSIEQLYTMNPAFNRWATDPNGPHYLIIPLKNADRFLNNLALSKPEDRIKWQRHKIASGESLSVIAANYHTTVAALQQINNLKGKHIRAGKSLIIPIATRSLDQYTLSADARRKALQNKARKGHKIRYVVEQGDTFWDLSQKYGVSMKALAKWNGMSPRDPLYTGKTLIIWARTNANHAQDSSVTPVTFSTPPQQSTTRSIRYSVREGDSLSVISQKFRVSVSELQEWNSLTGDQFIHPGQKLKIYVDVTRQSENI
jgi:membrane-bound lytic murein transglycosylase D